MDDRTNKEDAVIQSDRFTGYLGNRKYEEAFQVFRRCPELVNCITLNNIGNAYCFFRDAIGFDKAEEFLVVVGEAVQETIMERDKDFLVHTILKELGNEKLCEYSSLKNGRMDERFCIRCNRGDYGNCPTYHTRLKKDVDKELRRKVRR